MASLEKTKLGEWLRDRPWCGFLAFLALCITLAFRGVLFEGQSFVYRDFSYFSLPVAQFWHDSFWRGEMPFWNPYNNCGLPFLAQWNTMTLYPPTLIYIFLPLPWALNFFVLLHLAWAGLGAFQLARTWTGSSPGAAVAGMAYAFGGLILSCLIWPGSVAGLAWMPWVIWLAEQGCRQGGRRWVLAALAGALQMLAGFPEVVVMTWLMVGAFCLGQCWLDHRRGIPVRTAWRPLVRLALLGGMVAFLAAVQLLPFLELLQNSHRHGQYSGSQWPTPPWGLANYLVPLFHCRPSGQGPYLQPTQQWISSYYAGVGVLTLALLALRRRAGWRVWSLAVLTVTAIWLSFGDAGGLYRLMQTCFPVLGFMRYPVKYLVLPSLLLPVLAAYGVAMVSREGFAALRRWWLWLAAALGGIAAIVMTGRHTPAAGEVVPMLLQNGMSRAVVVLAFGAIGWFLVKANRSRTFLGAGMLMLAVWLDQVSHMPWQNPEAPSVIYQPGAVRSRLVMPQLGEARVMISPLAREAFSKYGGPDPGVVYYAQRFGLACNSGLIDRVPTVDGFYSLYLQTGGDVYSAFYFQSLPPMSGLMDFLGARMVTQPGEIIAWQPRPTASPLITAGQQPVFVTGEESLAGIKDPHFNGRARVYLPPEAASLLPQTQAVSAAVTNEHWEQQRVTFTVESAAPTVAVVAQSYYPCWQARVDGAPVPLWQANHAFQALPVPAGRHEVEIKYVDHRFQAGAVISLISLLGLLGWLWRDARNNRKMPVPP